MIESLRHPLMSALLVAVLVSGCSENKEAPATSESATPTATPEVSSAAEPSSGIDNRGTAAEVDPSKWWSVQPRPDWANYKQVKTLNPWFEVYQVMNGIYAIYEPGQFEEVISFLIIGEREALLFDTGLGMGNILSVVKTLTRKRITVLNSHGHYDHVGGNHQFDNIIGRNTKFTRERAKGIPHEEVAEFASDDWIWKTHPPNFYAKTYSIKPWEFSRWVEEGQFIDLGGVSLEVVFAPGHAPDGIVLIDHARRLMFTGDVFYPAPLYAHLEGSNFDDYAATAEKLAGMVDQVDYLLTSHNVPVADSSFLPKLDAAFKAIIAETASFTASGDGREYSFEGFSILTEDPPLEVELFTPL